MRDVKLAFFNPPCCRQRTKTASPPYRLPCCPFFLLFSASSATPFQRNVFFILQGTAACCGDQLRLNPPSLLAPNKPFVGAGGDTVSVGEVNIAIPGEKSHPEQPQRLHRRQQQQQQR